MHLLERSQGDPAPYSQEECPRAHLPIGCHRDDDNARQIDELCDGPGHERTVSVTQLGLSEVFKGLTGINLEVLCRCGQLCLDTM